MGYGSESFQSVESVAYPPPQEYNGRSIQNKERTMNTLVFALLMQVASTSFIVSTKAGVVNYVKGATTVKAATTVAQGKIVATGPGGAVELLLNPGSYLRMGENTRVVLDKVELYDIAVRILEGSAIIDSNGFTKELPLTVTTGDMKMEIIKDGILSVLRWKGHRRRRQDPRLAEWSGVR